jgi:hypothetical protein
MDATLRIGEHVGFRAFTVRGVGLWSIGYGAYEWLPGVNEAHCDRVGKRGNHKRSVWVNDPMDPEGLIERTAEASDHGRIPSPTCECGFYAYRSEGLARARLGAAGFLAPRSHFGNFGVDDRQALGKVKLWGRVVCGVDGYRAQFASVVALILEDRQAFEEVRARYDIPAIPPNDNVATGFVTSFEGSSIRVQTVHADLGWYEVLGSEIPQRGQEVTLEFEEHDGRRRVTSMHVHPNDG